MESEGVDDVQKRLFANGDSGRDQQLCDSSVTAPTARNGTALTHRRNSDQGNNASRPVVSVIAILAVLAALLATYLVEIRDEDNILKSAPAQLAIASLLWGFASFAFTWWYTYFDSHDPGSFPTSPLKISASPVKPHIQVQWHFSYIMAPVNGVVAMFLYLYWKLVWLQEHGTSANAAGLT